MLTVLNTEEEGHSCGLFWDIIPFFPLRLKKTTRNLRTVDNAEN
jgi:hypothetical protein